MQGTKSDLLLLLPPLALVGNQWNITLPGDNMRFQGLIMASSCRVEASDRQIAVNLGQISSSQFHDVGEDSNPIPFAIHLQDCSTAVGQYVGMAFHGVADGKNPDMLSVGEGLRTANGIGIALFGSQGQQLPLNRPPDHWVLPCCELTTLSFIAKYRATGRQVTGGMANAQAWSSLTCQ